MSKYLVDDISKAINDSNQSSIFSNVNTDTAIEEACCRYLRFKGYSIFSPKKFSRKINGLDDLISYFYLLLNNRNKDGFMTSYNIVRDRVIAKRFLESRINISGANKEYALNECGEIIKTVFENEKEFNFKYEITFAIFGQGKLKWITDKAISIMNAKVKEKYDIESDVIRNRAMESYDTSDIGLGDIDEILNSMKE
jgi:hypothetical protein